MKNEMMRQLDELAQIAARYSSVAEGTLADISGLKDSIASFRAYVPFLGVFTVGKSSLLNVWLGEDLLPEAQGATTALPTELLPGAVESMVVVGADGTEKILPNLPKDENEANAPEASTGAYAYCTSPSENLQKVFPIVPVDMPGINSGIRRHTEAIYRYANRGSAFFLVFMPEEGTLPGAMKAFLQELDLAGRPVWVVITKCDTAQEEKVRSVSENIQTQLRLIGIEAAGVLHCARGDSRTAADLQQALLSLNVQELNFQAHRNGILRVGLRLRDQITALKESEQLDTAGIDSKIREYERAAEDLREALGREEKKLSVRLNNLPDSVGNAVYAALLENTDALIESYEKGEAVFATRLTGIVNKVVSESIESNLEKDFSETVRNIANDMKIESSGFVDPSKIKESMENARQVLDIISKTLKTIKTTATWYRLITTGLALTTSVLAPVIELILIFLPDLLSIVMDKKAIIREKLRDALNSKVYPQIQTAIISGVREEVPEIERELLAAIRKEWSDRIDDTLNALESARQDRESTSKSHAQSAAAYDAQIEKIERILASFRSFKNESSHASVS